MIIERNEVTSRAVRGNDVFFLMNPRGSATVVLAEEGSSAQGQLRWLLNGNSDAKRGYRTKRFGVGATTAHFYERLVLQELGIM